MVCTEFFIFSFRILFASFNSSFRYADAMEREAAAQVLKPFKDGTFLIRKSTNPKHLGDFALSIKCVTSPDLYFKMSVFAVLQYFLFSRFGDSNHPVKHIKISKTLEQMYFLADCKMFRSIPVRCLFYI